LEQDFSLIGDLYLGLKGLKTGAVKVKLKKRGLKLKKREKRKNWKSLEK
jgi:hypothetical protein